MGNEVGLFNFLTLTFVQYGPVCEKIVILNTPQGVGIDREEQAKWLWLSDFRRPRRGHSSKSQHYGLAHIKHCLHTVNPMIPHGIAVR